MTQPGALLSHQWKPLIVCPHRELSARIRSAMAELGYPKPGQLGEYPPAGTVATSIAENGYNVCFLDVVSDQEHALGLLSEAAPAVPVVALNPLNDADLILRCLRRGGREFLSEVSTDQVRAVLERLAGMRAPPEDGRQAPLFGVVPGKAGCGASTLAAHLAVALQRSLKEKVLLVDADCLAASIAFLLQLRAGFHLGDAVRDCDRVDEHVWSRMAVPYHGIDVLTAPENPSTRLDVDPRGARLLLRFWRQHYAAVLLDLPEAPLAVAILNALGGEILLVTTNELAALHATRRSLEFLEQNGVDPGRIKLLVTRYTPASGLKREDLEKALKVAPYAVLSNDYAAVQHAVLEGKLVSTRSPFGRSVQVLAERLLDKASPRKHTSWFGFLRT